MAIYALTAVHAANSLIQSASSNYILQWQQSVALFTQSAQSRKKSCPLNTFVGLCRAGSILGISKFSGPFHPSVNGIYAVAAVQLLHQGAPPIKKTLWPLTLNNVGVPHIKENGQLDVVLGLHSAGLI